MRLLLACLLLGACATTAPAPERPPLQLAQTCAHGMPVSECTVCHPEMAAEFKARGDWCEEHAVPESHCLKCHPELHFYVLPPLPAGADLVMASRMGEDVPSLDAFAAPGKLTVFDFYAHWCGPCKEVDAFMYGVMATRKDVAYRKLNIYQWDSPLAKRYLGDVQSLPYLVVYGSDGKKKGEVKGIDVDALARLLE